MAIVGVPRLRVRTYMLFVGLAAVLVWVAMMGLRSYVYYRRASIYSSQERAWRENARRDLRQGVTRTVAARWGVRIADHYAPLVLKYHRAMWRPWIPVDSEPPFFYPAGPPSAEIPQPPPGKR